MVKQIGGVQNLIPAAKPELDGKVNAQMAEEFKKALGEVKPSTAPTAPAVAPDKALKFSQHAIDRMKSRGITFAPEKMQEIAAAVSKAAEKGSKDTLVLSGDNALIVSVKNNTVVTVMDKNMMKENVFTNIDSTVVV